MVSSMGGNAAGDGEFLDGKHVTYKARDVSDNGGMTCEVEVSGGGVEYSGGIEVSSVERPTTRPPGRPQSRPPPLLLLRPQIDCILTTVDDIGGLMDGSCDIDALSSCAAMRWSSPIRRKTNLVI